MATKIKEFANNTKPRNVNIKKVKQSILNSALTFLKEGQMVFNTFRSGIFLVPLEKSEGESDELFPWEFYGRTLASESLTEIWSEDLASGRSTEGIVVKMQPLKEMMEKLLVLIANVEAGNTSKKSSERD